MIKKFFSFSLIILIISSPALATELNHASDRVTPIQLQGVGNLYRVNNNLYRSGQPTEEGMKNLEKIGIKTIINLRAFYTDTDEIKGTALLNEELSINAWQIKDEDIIHVLLIIEKKENGPFLIHCEYGADRTGVMIAMYRIVEQGWSREEAIEEMVDGGYGFHSIWSNIIDYIKNVDVDIIKMRLAQSGTN
jgi:protein tyrosine/serine phosphatase